jgi:hypothetical protein
VAAYRDAVAARWKTWTAKRDGAPRIEGAGAEAAEGHHGPEQESDRPEPTTRSGEMPRNGSPSERLSVDGRSGPAPEAFFDISAVPQISNGWARCVGVALSNGRGQPRRIFEQGETASFLYEFELLQDIEVPIGGLLIQDNKGIVVHGKSTLEYGTDVPTFIVKGSRLRFRQDIALEIGAGEYSFEVGLAAMSLDDYKDRALYSHGELNTKIARLCHLSEVGQLSVVLREHASPVQLLHHGVANLSGNCRVMVQAPARCQR